MKVLDHGFVELIDTMGSDDSIVRAARVSHAANMKTGEDPEADTKLVNYLYRNHHTSPFEHVLFTFHVKAPIFVFRQWHRHRTWSFNEVSARYTELPEEFYMPSAQTIGTQSGKNHQARDNEVLTDDPVMDALLIKEHCEAAFEVYKTLLARGVARELARTVLPVATYSEMYGTVDLHNLMHFLDLRLSEHSQYEIRVYAEAIHAQIGNVVPAALAAWEVMRDGR